MAIQQKLQARLSQKLILTPSLQQAIKLLPMSTLELVDLLTQEVVENPLLEEVPAEEQQQADAAAQVDKADADPEPTSEKQDTWDDADYEYFFGDYLDDGYRPRAPREIKDLPPIENTLSTTRSLADHLVWQLSLRTSDDLLREIGAAIIGNLNEDGYLVASIDEIAAMGAWPTGEVERVLTLVQTFDPVGVAARDPQECLLLQIRHLGLEGDAVRDHRQGRRLPAAAAAPPGLRARAPSGHVGRRAEAAHRDPAAPRSEAGQSTEPDCVTVRDSGCIRREGRGPVRGPAQRGRDAATAHQPRVPTDARQGQQQLRGDPAYVKEKFRSALWLIKSVDQRQKTIHKVATSIIHFQREFLDSGIEHLRPLVLRDVASDIGMHESTVSRVVNNKYMHTPQGVFEMKYFFHSGIHSSYGENVSSVTIKQRIRKIIEQEDARKPLSDSRIVRLLQDDGLVLARRTIAKYREELRIPTSSQRRVLY